MNLPPNFVQALANKYEVSKAEFDVFSIAIKEKEKEISPSEIAQTLNDKDNVNVVRTRLGEVYRKFNIPGRGRGKLEKLRKKVHSLYEVAASQVQNDDSVDEWVNVLTKLEPESVTPESKSQRDSDLYIKRPPIESTCYQEILQPGALICIKAPSGMGKTELMSKILNHAAENNCTTLSLSLRLAQTTDFDDLDKFLQWFCISVTGLLKDDCQESEDANNRKNSVEDLWENVLGGSLVKCQTYFENFVLNKDKPLVLGLDDLDLIFSHPKIAEEFLGMLRVWHENAKNRPIWQGLRLVLLHTLDYDQIDIYKSPFNAGIRINLPEFTKEQVQELAKRYRSGWDTDKIDKLMKMVGGHPYLVRETLEKVVRLGMTFEDVLENASSEVGIYGDYLRGLWRSLQHLQPENQDGLLEEFKKVVTAEQPVELEDRDLALKLHDLGLVTLGADNCVEPRCTLYREYFRSRLGVKNDA